MTTLRVESGVTIAAGSIALADNKITKNGATYSLVGKTVTASIRFLDAPDTIIHASLEDVAVTPGGGTYTQAQGGVAFTITSAMSVLLTPSAVGPFDLVKRCFIQYDVTTDDYQPTEVVVFDVRRALN